MSDWIDVCAENSLSNGQNQVVDINGVEVVIFKIAGNFYAIEDVCTHDGVEISSGLLEGSDIICPRHGARFCVKTGAVKSPPAYEAIHCFPIEVKRGRVWVRDNNWD